MRLSSSAPVAGVCIADIMLFKKFCFASNATFSSRSKHIGRNMKSTGTAKATKGKARTSSGTSSSRAKVRFAMLQDTLELGKLLVEEMRDHGSDDTLTVWLLHYIAELILKAEGEGDSPIGAAAQREACEMILKFWEHRATLSGRANPMEEYRSALQLLRSLRKDGYFVFGRLDDDGDPVESFRARSAALMSSLLVLSLPDDKDEPDAAKRNLSGAERDLIREFNVIRIRRVVHGTRARDNDDEDPREVLKRDILDDIVRLRESLDAIAAKLSS